MRPAKAVALAALVPGLLLAAAVALHNLRSAEPADAPAAASTDPAVIARGEYLARAGNCRDCHTPRGAAPYSGGRGIPTPFGTVYSTNLTPDARSGIGEWTPAQFRRALREGRSRDGRLLYPAFPYDSFTAVSDADADALFAYLRSLPPVDHPNRPHALRFPFDTQAALAVWRALYFRPARFVADPARPAEWNRGAYLVRGLGHCSACHAPRNVLGASVAPQSLAGGAIPMQLWFAPALGGASADTAQLLKAGVSRTRALLGPMAEVVLHSTQHLSDGDRQAIATYLGSLPRPMPAPARLAPAGDAAGRRAQGETLYADHCARCHGDDGRGVAGAYVALAGNPKLLAEAPVNAALVVLGGAFAASTADHPRPFGMPPFGIAFGDEQVAALLTYLRSAWGHQAAAVEALQVERWRGSVRP